MRARGRIGLLALCGGLLLIGCQGGAGPEPGGKDAAAKKDGEERGAAELKWAEDVADAFLHNLRTRDYEQQKALTTGQFQANYKDSGGVFRLREQMQLKTWTFAERKSAPDGDEVRLVGTFTYTAPWTKGGGDTGKVLLLLTKDGSPGKWRVNFVNASLIE